MIGFRGVADRLRRSLGGGAPETLVPPAYLAQSRALLRESLADCDGGDPIEIGVYRGGSLYRLGEEMAAHPGRGARRLIGIDTFEGHPYSDPERDPRHHPKGRFADTSYDLVRRAMARFPFASVIRGECSAVFAGLATDQAFCFAHVDVDICQAAVACMEYVYPRLRPRGAMVFDEYAGYGQRPFIAAYFEGKPVTLERRTGLGANDYGLMVRRWRQ